MKTYTLLDSNFPLMLQAVVDLMTEYPGCARLRVVSEEDFHLSLSVQELRARTRFIYNEGDVVMHPGDTVEINARYHVPVKGPLSPADRTRFGLEP